MTRVEQIGDATGHKRGSQHYNWQGDAVSERGGRSRALRAYPSIGPCEVCGAERSERHHKDGNTANNHPDNIHVVCRRCHMEEDGRLQIVREQMAELSKTGRLIAAQKKRARTHCKHGHELSKGNVYINPRGVRICKACRRVDKANYHARRKP